MLRICTSLSQERPRRSLPCLHRVFYFSRAAGFRCVGGVKLVALFFCFFSFLVFFNSIQSASGNVCRESAAVPGDDRHPVAADPASSTTEGQNETPREVASEKQTQPSDSTKRKDSQRENNKALPIGPTSIDTNYESVTAEGRGRDIKSDEEKKASHVRMLVVVGTLGSIFVLCSVAEWFIDTFNIPLPISVASFFLGMFLSYIKDLFVDIWAAGSGSSVSTGITEIEHMDSTIIFFVILPICLYESAAHMPFHVFKQVQPSVLLLAGPGVVLNMALVAIFFRFYFPDLYSWTGAFLVGSILSATDPVAVVMALRKLGAPSRLGVILEGESLLNDGSSVVFFEFFLAMLVGHSHNLKDAAFDFCRLALVGPAIGFLCGIASYTWLRKVRQHFVIQVTFIVGVFYFLAASAEHLFSSSAVLTVVTFGLTVSGYTKAGFDRSTILVHEHFIHILSCLANQALFLMAGVLARKFMRKVAFKAIMIMNIFLLYLVCMAARLVVLVAFSPFLRRIGYGLNTKEGVVLWWGSLRGGVALALAIVLDDNSRLPVRFRDHATFYIAGFTMLSLVINGTTFNRIYEWLKIYKTSIARRAFFKQALITLEQKYVDAIEPFKAQWFVDADILRVVMASGVVPDLSQASLVSNGEVNLAILDPMISLYNTFCDRKYFAIETFCMEEHQRAMVTQPAMSKSYRSSGNMAKVLSIIESNRNRKAVDFDEDHTNTPLSEGGINHQEVVGGSPVISESDNLLPFTLKTRHLEDFRLPLSPCGAIFDVLEVIFNSTKQTYQRLYTEHAVQAEALLILNSAADSALDSIIVDSSTQANVAVRLLDEETAPFSVHWERIKSQISTPYSSMFEYEEWLRQTSAERVDQGHPACTIAPTETYDSFQAWLGNFYFLRKLRFQRFCTDVEVLFAYITAYEEMKFEDHYLRHNPDASPGEKDDNRTSLQMLLGSTQMSKLESKLAEAKHLLVHIMRSYPWMGCNAMAKIQTQMLLNVKRKLVARLTEEDIVLHEDAQKIVCIIKEHHLNMSRYTPFPSPFSTAAFFPQASYESP